VWYDSSLQRLFLLIMCAAAHSFLDAVAESLKQVRQSLTCAGQVPNLLGLNAANGWSSILHGATMMAYMVCFYGILLWYGFMVCFQYVLVEFPSATLFER
jgi:hypothetical protein